MIVMNILFISSYFYPDGGGAENYAYNIAKGLVKRGHEVTVICSSKNGSSYEEFLDGIRVIRLKYDFTISTAPIRLPLFYEVYRMIKKEKFGIININFHLPYYPDIAAFLSKMCKIPSVLTYHNDIVKRETLTNLIAQIYNYSINKISLHAVDLIITPSPYCYNESKYLKNYKNKLIWIPPGVDIDKYPCKKSYRIHELYNIPSSSKIVLFVGVMSKAHTHKGVDYLIRAFKRVLKEINDVYLVLVGRGDMIPEYRKLCNELGISDNVIFTGFVDDKELVEYYCSSDIVVLPSITVQEGFGMVLIEAGACGRPVIGSEIGGIKYVIREGETGLLVPPRNVDALAEAIIKILKDEDLAKKLGKNGRKLVEKNYTWDISVKKTIKVYEELI